VANPSPETQVMLDILKDDYGWTIGINSDDIWEFDSEAGRGKTSLETRRENWLRGKFPNNNKRISRNAKMAFMN
jgi:hypothetical protein